jgi:hypothetical protein
VTDIFPAEDQPIGEVITELTQLGLVEGTDFKLHFTWDMRPFIQADPDAYKKWEKKHSGDSAESEKDTGKSSSSKDSSSSSDDDDSKGSTARKRGGK